MMMEETTNSIIRKNLTDKDIILQTVEELAELQHALLKFARMSNPRNPAAGDPEEIIQNVNEEYADVKNMMVLLSGLSVINTYQVNEIGTAKLKRWVQRLNENGK